MAVDKAYVATLLRKRAYYAAHGNEVQLNEINLLLDRIDYKEPVKVADPEPETPAADPAPKGRTSPAARTKVA